MKVAGCVILVLIVGNIDKFPKVFLSKYLGHSLNVQVRHEGAVWVGTKITAGLEAPSEDSRSVDI